MFDPNNPNGGTYNHVRRLRTASTSRRTTSCSRRASASRSSPASTYDLTDDVRLHVKGLYNNRTSTNQAAPEPIFVGPGRRHRRHRRHDQHPPGQPVQPVRLSTLDAASNLLVVTRRPVEVGPRIFDQDVDTMYFNIGLDGTFGIGDRTLGWDVNYAHSENKATQDIPQRLQRRQDEARAGRSGDLRTGRRLHAARPVRRPGPADDAGPDRLHPHPPDRLEQADAGPVPGQRHRRPVRHRRPHGRLRRGRRASPLPRRLQSRSAAPDRRVAGLVRRAGVGVVRRRRDLHRVQLPGAGVAGPQCRGPLLRLLDLRQRHHRQGRLPLAADRGPRRPRHVLERLPRAEPRRAVRPDPVRRDAGRSVRFDRSPGPGIA